jgi:tRNA threonylcarbamoyladenosine biosynthesis protein TsaE
MDDGAVRFRTHSAADTRSFGHALGTLLEAGDFLALSGGLGSGKTVFVQGVARGLGYEGPVASPSFVIVSEYPGRIRILHVDLYRIEDPRSLDELGLREIFWSDGVTLVEWADRATQFLPQERLDLDLGIVGPRVRDLILRPHGPRAARLLSLLAAGRATPSGGEPELGGGDP